MAPLLSSGETLRRLFAALTEHTFQVELGVADPKVTDYLVDLLLRFLRTDAIFRIRDATGRRLDEVADMLLEAEERTARPQREVYRHIGDFTLFWSGVYPEALRRLRAPDRKDHLLDYQQKGKESYYIASTFDEEPYREEAPVLRRLSYEFEMFSYGLHCVRREWEKLPERVAPRPWSADQN
ncbi:MAG TPA: hypothetical protein EYP14_07860 [Planctomycetaceae bacterium]|nr:hypothetical protein [Planctomycetaceae bacterium]